MTLLVERLADPLDRFLGILHLAQDQPGALDGDGTGNGGADASGSTLKELGAGLCLKPSEEIGERWLRLPKAFYGSHDRARLCDGDECLKGRIPTDLTAY